MASGPVGGVPLRDLLEAELSAFASRFSMEGAPIILGGAFAQQFAVVIHELATNAVKYGALLRPGGIVAMEWHIAPGGDGPSLVFSWVERGGPLVAEPTTRGFGTQLIAASLSGNSRMSFAPTGVEFAASIPLSQVMPSTRD